MFRLTLNNRPVVLKKDTQFKLTRENAMLTDSGDYTFDVTLPLKGCRENILALGAIHRMEVSKVPLSSSEYAFQLLADELSIEGTAVITSVTDAEVKLQLLAGRSETNFRMTDAGGADLYIDELDLGTVWDSLGEWKPASMDDCIRITKYSSWHGTDTEQLQYGSSSETDCVCFPIYSEADDKVANDRVFSIFGVNGHAGNYQIDESFWYWPLQTYHPCKPFESGKEEKMRLQGGQTFAGQPYLCFILERVLEAIGAPLAKADNCIRTDASKRWMADIFVANSRGTIRYAKMLPHWTVKDFLKECSNFFGVYIRSNGSRSWVENRVPSGSEVIKLEQVIDEYTTEIEEDEQGSDISVGNVGFAYPDLDSDHYAILPDEVWEMATIVDEDTFNRASDEEKKRMLVTDPFSDGIKAYQTYLGQWTLWLVNSCAPYLRNPDSREVHTELRIVPVRIEPWHQRSIPVFELDQGVWRRSTTWSQYDALIMATSTSARAVAVDELIIDDYLKGETDRDSDNRDCIEVGYREPENQSLVVIPYLSGSGTQYIYLEAWGNVDGAPFAREHATGQAFPGYLTYGRFDISQYRGNRRRSDTFVATVIEPSGVTSTKVKHCFTFLDRGTFPVDATYLIRGRQYICEKIEFTITEKGIDPKKKAYFYEKE